MTQKTFHVTVSGSFHRAMDAIQLAVAGLSDAGVKVLSPADPRVVDAFGDFLFVASDRARSIRLVQSRHLAAIDASHLVWLEAPNGYIGQSAAMEIGYAARAGIPVFSSETPSDLGMRRYVKPVGTWRNALTEIGAVPGQPAASNVLLNPEGIIQAAHDELERIDQELRGVALANGSALSAAKRLRRSVVDPISKGT